MADPSSRRSELFINVLQGQIEWLTIINLIKAKLGACLLLVVEAFIRKTFTSYIYKDGVNSLSVGAYCKYLFDLKKESAQRHIN